MKSVINLLIILLCSCINMYGQNPSSDNLTINNEVKMSEL